MAGCEFDSGDEENEENEEEQQQPVRRRRKSKKRKFFDYHDNKTEDVNTEDTLQQIEISSAEDQTDFYVIDKKMT